ncbi:MAG: yiiD [Firmicutes bacterium]|nr:yiiD [Bacillota bacterium]
MEKEEFEKFLHDKIPMTKAMEVRVEEYSPSKVRLAAKLEPNINDKGTAFGGSISSLMTLCGWSMAFRIMVEEDPEAQIVVQKSSINYIAPIRGDFAAECEIRDEESLEQFLCTYRERRKGRLKLGVRCYGGGTLSAEYEGQYVAYR